MIELKDKTLIEQYDLWIKKVTRKMWYKYRMYHDYEDFLGIAYVAATEALKNYDPTKAKFSTYITPRIEGAIIRSVSTISNAQHGMFTDMLNFIDEYTEEHGKIPAQHIIIKYLNLTEAQFLTLMEATQKRLLLSTDDISESDLCVSYNIDNTVEYEKIMAIATVFLSKDQQRALNDFIDGGTYSVKVKHIIGILKSKLNLGEEE